MLFARLLSQQRASGFPEHGRQRLSAQFAPSAKELVLGCSDARM